MRHGGPVGVPRVAKMPEFLAYATDPDGTYAQLGDTDLDGPGHQDTIAEFAATAGASGPKPPTTIRRYAAGYLFARSGWGETRAFADETYLTLRFGPGQILHGQHDGQSITLSSQGRRLIVDPGKYTYTPGAWKTYFESRAAHNVVVVDGLAYDARKATAFGTLTKANALYATTTNSGYTGVTNRRRIVWSRTSDYVIVDDQLSSTATRTFRQTWHLARGSAPTISGNRVDTHFTGAQPRGRAAGRTPRAAASSRARRARSRVGSPRSTRSSSRRRCSRPRSGPAAARFLTLLVPYSGARPTIAGRVVSLTSTGYIVDVTIGTHRERVTVNDERSDDRRPLTPRSRPASRSLSFPGVDIPLCACTVPVGYITK